VERACNWNPPRLFPWSRTCRVFLNWTKHRGLSVSVSPEHPPSIAATTPRPLVSPRRTLQAGPPAPAENGRSNRLLRLVQPRHARGATYRAAPSDSSSRERACARGGCWTIHCNNIITDRLRGACRTASGPARLAGHFMHQRTSNRRVRRGACAASRSGRRGGSADRRLGAASSSGHLSRPGPGGREERRTHVAVFMKVDTVAPAPWGDCVAFRGPVHTPADARPG